MVEQSDWTTTAYRYPLLTEQDILRVRLRVIRGRVVRFTVQYEAVVAGETYPVVRDDNAHGAAHRDPMDLAGREVAKDWIRDKTNDDIVNDAILDIKTNWPSYREAFLETRK